jgi:hypothetical protein
MRWPGYGFAEVKDNLGKDLRSFNKDFPGRIDRRLGIENRVGPRTRVPMKV